jgi:hypothetical protein
MREEIIESIKRMTKEDCEDIAITCNLEKSTKVYIKKMALADEDIAEYVLQY